MTKKISKVERIKEESENLRGDLAGQLRNGHPNFDKNAIQILKFHGMYQQDDRDVRRIRGRDKEWSFMIRSRIPGGGLTAGQYLAHDLLADTYANGTLRLTTRQTIQLHGVIKGDLASTLRQLHDEMVIAIGACGDIVRNVMCCPAPAGSRTDHVIQEYAKELSDHLLPRSRAYYEIWIDGEKAGASRHDDPEHEPLYGKNYLPRKFKIGIAWPGDNCVDVFTHDIGLVATLDDHDDLKGFTVLVGGGMGMNHKKKETFPRLADPLAWVPREQIIDVVTHIVAIQRDYGDRENRKHARFKYLIDEWGIPKFRKELEDRLGYRLAPPRELGDMRPELHLGWNRQSDGRWYLGLSVENGRIKDTPEIRLKTGLREIVSRFGTDIRLTPNQDILLTNIAQEDRPAIEAMIREHNIPHDHTLSNARMFSMACPALPTCGLAVAESERVFPDIIRELEHTLEELDLEKEIITFRMTGCPNGCARPYVADIGFVGHSMDKYDIFIGGDPAGRRLNRLYRELVPLEELVETVKPLLARYQKEKHNGESFGDFSARVNLIDEPTQVSEAGT